MKHIILKLKRKLWGKFVSKIRSKKKYPYIYRSYWNYIFSKKNKCNESVELYLSACPNPGAGIGHQLSNWISGYWWAKQFELKFAHIPFSTTKWDRFLGFGEDEISIIELTQKGYKKIRLPLFEEFCQQDLLLISKIIKSYSGQKVVFICEQDQGYKNQYGIIDELQQKFYNAPSRKENQLIYSKDSFNIAIHVRRGDITIGQVNKTPNLLMRWQNNDYFVNVLSNVLKVVKTKKPIVIYLFSQGVEGDFEDFKLLPNIHFCLEMSAQDSFLHMVYADLLITSKSSFSYKPALLNKGIKVCPKDFWHGYPEAVDWILADADGNIRVKSIKLQ